MAVKSSTSVGVGATIVILGVAAFVLFVLTIIFFGKMGKLEKELADLQQSTNEYVRENERQDDSVRRFADLASRERQSVIGYLVASHRSTMSKVSGSSGDTFEQLESKLAGFENVGGSLLQTLRDRDGQIATQQRQLDDAQAALSVAAQDLLNESQRIDTIKSDYDAEQNAMATKVAQLEDDVASYRQGTNDLGIDMERRLEDCRNAARESESRMRDEVRVIRAENLRLQDSIARLQQEKSKDMVSPTDEFALVDGFVAGINSVSREASISLGSDDKIKLGMTFAVYAEASSIRPDSNGNYPRPKGELEVIRISDSSATCRILTELTGNPIVRGDVIANPVYDPNKVYTFLVYGNFDINGDGVYSMLERPSVEAMISEWGGTITDELTGDVDFLVLGARPVLPPQPSGDDPTEYQMEFIRLRNIVNRYDDLHDKAAKTSLPILNLNRLETLLAGR